MTKVISFLAGPGCGKSTTSHGLMYELKRLGKDVEYVSEYAKKWAWAGKKITLLDQSFLFGKQSQAESSLYGKVDYIVSDSSLYLAPCYEEYYSGTSMVLDSVLKYFDYAHKHYDVEHINILLTRHKPYNPKGRYETEKQANEFDSFLRTKLKEWNAPYVDLSIEDSVRIPAILNLLNL